jgi:hypothetical protein
LKFEPAKGTGASRGGLEGFPSPGGNVGGMVLRGNVGFNCSIFFVVETNYNILYYLCAIYQTNIFLSSKSNK